MKQNKSIPLQPESLGESPLRDSESVSTTARSRSRKQAQGLFLSQDCKAVVLWQFQVQYVSISHIALNVPCVRANMRGHMWVWMEAREQPQVSSSGMLSTSFESRSLLGLKLTN